jgi:hypothetical protein
MVALKRCALLIILVFFLLISSVSAAENISILKAVESADKITAPETIVNISDGLVTSELHTESKSTVNNIVKKLGLSKSISETSMSLKDIDKYRATAEHIENNVNLVGKHSIIYDNVTMNITVQSQSYDRDTGMNKFNLTATVNGKSLLIHNPLRVYGIPVTVKQMSNEMVYLDPLEIESMIPIGTIFDNKTIVYNQSLYSYLQSTPVSREIITEVEAPKDAVLQNLAYALSYIEFGEPTFDDPDPTTIFYASGSWTVPINTVNANMTVVGGGGGGSGGYGIATWSCGWAGYCSCSAYNPAMVTGRGVAGTAGDINFTLYNIHDGEIYAIVVGNGGMGGAGTGNNCYTDCGDTGACNPSNIFSSGGQPRITRNRIRKQNCGNSQFV